MRSAGSESGRFENQEELDTMNTVSWGIIGCGDVTEKKSGPGLYKAEHSRLTAVMRRNGEAAKDYAERHNVPKWYDNGQALIDDAEVDVVYVATPPSTHLEYALASAAAGKPCLVEKPMAMNANECEQMVQAFKEKSLPLWVAFYRRALPRFLKLRDLLNGETIGKLTSVEFIEYSKLAAGEEASRWRYDPAIAGAGNFVDLGSHGFDILDYLVGPISEISGYSINSGGTYQAEDVTVACFRFENEVLGTGTFNFNSSRTDDWITFTGSLGKIRIQVYKDSDIEITMANGEQTFVSAPYPDHVCQPLQETIINELRGHGKCESTGESGLRTQRVLDACVRNYYGRSNST